MHLRESITLFGLPQSWRALARWRRKTRLHEHLLHTIGLLVESVVALVDVLHLDTVGNHPQRINLALLDTRQQVLPVKMDRCLTIADETDTALHEGT